MKTLSNDTRRAILSPVVRLVPLVTLSYLVGSAVRKLYLSDREYRHDGNFYLDLIAGDGISDISYTFHGVGGIVAQTSARVNISNRTGNTESPLSQYMGEYALVAQDITIDYLFPPAAESIPIFAGKIRKVSITHTSIAVEGVSTALDQLYSVPTKTATLGEYPNVPLENLNRPIPVVFGSMNMGTTNAKSGEITAARAKDALLAPCMQTDFLSRKYISSARAKSYGLVYRSEDNGGFVNISIRQLTTGEFQTVNAEPVDGIYQRVEGYRDLASNYADGGVVHTSDMVLSSPLDIIHALLRDTEIGMGISTAQIDQPGTQDRASMPAGYRFDFSMHERHTFDALSRMATQGLIRIELQNGKWKVRPHSTDRVFGHFGKMNILQETFQIEKSQQEIYTEFFLRYGWGHEGYYRKSLIRDHHTKHQGTGSFATSGRYAIFLLDATAPAPPQSIITGDRMWCRGKYYTIRRVISPTRVEIGREDGSITSETGSDVYYIGTNFDYRCFRAFSFYGRHAYKDIESQYIQDSATAESFLDEVVSYYSRSVDIISFTSGIGAVMSDVGDIISVDYPPLLPAEKVGTLVDPISWPDTVFRLSHAVTPGAVIVLTSSDVCEMIRVISVSGLRIDACERGYGNTIPRRWVSGQAFTMPARFQITDIVYSLSRAQVSITARDIQKAP